jgi:hypothetical protein
MKVKRHPLYDFLFYLDSADVLCDESAEVVANLFCTESIAGTEYFYIDSWLAE